MSDSYAATNGVGTVQMAGGAAWRGWWPTPIVPKTIPNDSVGLARVEFIISTHVRVHPVALLRPGRFADAKHRKELQRLAAGYQDKGLYFLDRLAGAVAMIAAAFWPKDVIVRRSHFKSNEYAGFRKRIAQVIRASHAAGRKIANE